jgi:hypothetical protein
MELPTVEQRQAAVLRAEPYLAGETVLARALAQEHADMCAWVPGHSAACAHWTKHVNS